MATQDNLHPNLLDWMKRRDPNGKHARIVELLDQTNDIVNDMVVREANDTFGHRTVVRTGLSTPTWRKFYQVVQPSKSQTESVVATPGMLEDLLVVDKALADAENEPEEFMASEMVAKWQGMAQEIASTSIYGNELTEPEAFSGLAAHYNDAAAANAENIIGSTSGNTSSIWLVGWGLDTTFGFFPKGSSAGMHMTDLGVELAGDTTGSGGGYLAYRKHLRWDLGLCVRDWRANCRILVNTSTLTKNGASGGTGDDLIDLLTQAIEQVPQSILNTAKMRFYANRTVRSFLRRQIMNKVATSTLTMEQVAGKRVMMFDGIQVGRVDAILNTENDI